MFVISYPVFHFRRIKQAEIDLVSSDFYSSVLASLRESLTDLHSPDIGEIVCFGIGKISECIISRYQLALLLSLREKYAVELYIYDPVFTEREIVLLNELNCKVLSENIEGKYRVKGDKSTLFYLPHCSKQLSNNLLWANWGLQLSRCIIIANSFNKIVEGNTKKTNQNIDYILNVSPYMSEFCVINTFKYFDIFNDTAIHVFPPDKLKLLSEDFWSYNFEPKYLKNDMEFISVSLKHDLHV